MERFKTITNAQELFEFLSDIPESVRTELNLEMYEEVYERNGPTDINVEATQIFEDGCPISMFRISKVDAEE